MFEQLSWLPRMSFSYDWVDLATALRCMGAQKTDRRLERTFSTERQAAVTSAASLYRQYSEKYPTDTVPENDFALLVSELRPAIDDESELAPALAKDKSDVPATARTPAQAPVHEVRNDRVQQEIGNNPRDRNPGPPPNSKCLEFLGAWKEITKNSTGTKTSKRELNVLGWGFRE
jgi:hypothetical protein